MEGRSHGRHFIAAIGIDRYRHWPALSNAVQDARGTLELFQKLGFQQLTAPLFDELATGDAIQALVTDDLRELRPEDALVLFYAGHGGTRSNQLGDRVVKAGYLIPFDASNAPDKVSTWIDLEAWLRAVSLLPARHILVILDACHSGIALDPIIKWRDIGLWKDTPLSALLSRQSRRIITSALDNEVALDSGPIHGHSLFTGCLIEALTEGLGREDNTVTTGSELGLYVQRRVKAFPNSQQTPDFGTFAFDDRGEMAIPLLTRRPRSEPAADAKVAVPREAAHEAHDSSATGSPGAPTLRFPLRQSVLLGGAAAGAGALASLGWLWRTSSRPRWQKERLLLDNAVAQLSTSLGSEQAAGGGFAAGPYNDTPTPYNTAQDLTALLASVRTGRGVFDPERRSRAFTALARMSGEWKKAKSETPLMTTPPRSGAGYESRLASVVRVLVRTLAAYGTMNAATLHFEPSEYLLAMSEMLMRLP